MAVRLASEDDLEPRERYWVAYSLALGVSAACTLGAAVMYPYFELTNLIMVYLLGATIAALRLGRGPASLTAVTNTLAFDFFFVPPRYSFDVADIQYLVTFGVMLAVALIIATLGASVTAQTRAASARERRTALLYGMSRELVSTQSLDDLAGVAVRHVAETFASRVTLLVPDVGGRLQLQPGVPAGDSTLDADLSVAQWVHDAGTPAGFGTETLSGAPTQYLPLTGSQTCLGVLAIQPSQPWRLLLPEQRRLLETFTAQIALALERSRLQTEAEHARVTAETEGVRNTLLASISHDLRTPLAVIAGASSALSDPSMNFDPQAQRSLLAQIAGKSQDMADIISNVLDLMRYESGQFSLRLDWVSIDDLVNAALQRLGPRLKDTPIAVQVPVELPPTHVDGALVLQVLTNLLENAVKYTPPGTGVSVGAVLDGEFLRITVEDQGLGLPPGDLDQLFTKFQRGRDEGSEGGAGLGLSICRAIVSAHGGQIAASQRPGGGARFVFSLPIS